MSDSATQCREDRRCGVAGRVREGGHVKEENQIPRYRGILGSKLKNRQLRTLRMAVLKKKIKTTSLLL